MKIIIFGATGSIGSDLVDYFSKDHNIIAVYRNKKNILSKPNKNIKWIKLNLLKKIKLKIKADVIINCIVVHSFSNKNNYIDYINSNVISLKNILLFANAIRVKSFFNLSSIKTYGDINTRKLNEKNIYINPDILGATKILSEKLIEMQKFKYFNIRLPGVLSYTIKDKRRPWLNKIINDIINNKTVSIYNPQNFFNNVIDTIEIYKFIKNIINRKKVNSGTFNLSASKPIKIKTLILSIKTKLSSKSNVIFKKQKTRNYIILSESVKKNYNFKPETTMKIVDRYIGNIEII